MLFFTYVSGFVALVGITVMLKSFTQGLPDFITTPSRAGLENGEREWGKLVIFYFFLFFLSFFPLSSLSICSLVTRESGSIVS